MRGKAERSYSTFKVRRGGGEEISLVQGKEQWLRGQSYSTFKVRGAAVRRYPLSKVRSSG